MCYLNVMAGPVADHQWLITDHPDQTWVRGLWPDLPVDARLLTAEGEPRR
jgi:5-deoxy-glucuronate isomerase